MVDYKNGFIMSRDGDGGGEMSWIMGAVGWIGLLTGLITLALCILGEKP